MFSRISALLVVLLAAAGCATSAQQQHEQINSVIYSAFEQRGECYAAVAGTESAQALSGSIWFSADQPPLSYFANSSYPTDEDLPNIDRVAQASLSCDQTTKDALVSAHPSFHIIYSEFMNAKRSLALALLKKQVTYGEFHTAYGELTTLLDRVWAQNAQYIVTQLSRQHYAELETRRAAIQAFGQAMANQQAAMAARQAQTTQAHQQHRSILPKQTNCYAVGVGVQCTTW